MELRKRFERLYIYRLSHEFISAGRYSFLPDIHGTDHHNTGRLSGAFKFGNMFQPIAIRQIVIQQDNVRLKYSSDGIPVIQGMRTFYALKVLK